MDYIPQALPVYRGLPSYPGGASADTHYQNYKQSQCDGDLTTFWYGLPHDGTNYVIPPMFVKRVAGGAALAAFGLYNIDGSSEQIFLPLGFPATTVTDLDDTPNFEALIIDGERHSATGVETGKPYYFAFNDGTTYWYTEVFHFFDSETIPSSGAALTMPNACGGVEWIQLVWSNPNCVISETIPNTVGQILNLQAVLGRPQYQYNSKSEDDGQGGATTLFQRMDKRWEFFIVGPEYLADALASIQMFSDVDIVFQYGDTVSCSDIEVEAEWISACFARITFRFTATFLAKTACCG